MMFFTKSNGIGDDAIQSITVPIGGCLELEAIGDDLTYITFVTANEDRIQVCASVTRLSRTWPNAAKQR